MVLFALGCRLVTLTKSDYIYLIQTFLERSKFFRYIYGTGNYRNEKYCKK